MTPTDQARMVVERYCAAWSGADLVGLLDCYADEFTLHYFGQNPFSGDHVGKEAAVAVLVEVSTLAPRTLLAVEQIMAGPDAATIVVRERLERDGEAHDLRRVLRFRVAGDHLAECWLYDEDQRLIDRLWRRGKG
ncbi:MAG: nuclear transport factor 2 family protein [Acidimicrobiales bacterium]